MKALKRYLITLLIGALAAFGIMWSKDLFYQTDPKSIYHILTDAFFVVGTVMTCVGLLIFSTNEGTFDIIVYGMGSFLDMFRKTSKKKFHTFYDYRESRADKKIQFGYIVICGLVFLAVSMVMYWLYRQNS